MLWLRRPKVPQSMNRRNLPELWSNRLALVGLRRYRFSGPTNDNRYSARPTTVFAKLVLRRLTHSVAEHLFRLRFRLQVPPVHPPTSRARLFCLDLEQQPDARVCHETGQEADQTLSMRHI